MQCVIVCDDNISARVRRETASRCEPKGRGHLSGRDKKGVNGTDHTSEGGGRVDDSLVSEINRALCKGVAINLTRI